MNTKNNKKTQESISKINNVLCKLLKEKGHKDLTISEICKCAEINRSTFYAHFDSIEDALYRLCESRITKIYLTFLNTSLEYRTRVEQSIYIVKQNLDFFNYLFTNVHNLEVRVMGMLDDNLMKFDQQLNNEKTKLCLSFIISGLVGIGKTYFRSLNNNDHSTLTSKELTDIICNLINTNNPYFIIK